MSIVSTNPIFQGNNSPTSRAAVVCATLVAGTLATSFAAGQTVDGIVLAVGQRILIKNQVSDINNGIYYVSSTAPVRTEDMPIGMAATGLNVFIQTGSQAGTGWVCTSSPATVGTSSIVFEQYDVVDTLDVARGGTGVTSFGGTNTLLYTTTTGNLASIPTASNAFLVTNGSGVPAITSTLPSGLALTSPFLTTPNIYGQNATNYYTISPGNITSNVTLSLPPVVGSQTFVFTGQSQTITNKNLIDASVVFNNASDTSKTLQFDLSLIPSLSTITLQAPTASGIIATQQYAAGLVNGLDWKQSVRAKTTAVLNVTPSGSQTTKLLTSNVNGAIGTFASSFDGVSLGFTDRILVDNTAFSGANLSCGIYVVQTVGSGSAPYVLARSTDADTSSEVSTGMAMYIQEGSSWAGSQWTLITFMPIVLDVTALSFTQFTGFNGVAAGGVLAGTYPNPTLAPTGVVAGTYGAALAIPTLAVNAGGQITSASTSTAISLTTAGGGGTSLVNAGLPTAIVKNLTAGANITLTDNGTNVSIQAAGAAAFTTENLSTSTPNAALTPSANINITYITSTAGSGTNTGTLANGSTNGFQKTITIASSSVSYLLTITNYVNTYGAIGSYATTLFQSGSTISLTWDATLGAWITLVLQRPTATTQLVSVFIDPANSSNVIAVTKFGDLIGTANNAANTGTNTVATLINSCMTYLTTVGGGDIYFGAGTYFIVGSVILVHSNAVNMTLRAEDNAIFVVSTGTGIEVEGTNITFDNLTFTYQTPFSSTTTLDGFTYSTFNAFFLITANYITIKNCQFINLLGAITGAHCNYITLDNNSIQGCRGGQQFNYSLYVSVTNCNYANSNDDCISLTMGAQFCVVANNVIDLTRSLTTTAGAHCVVVGGSTLIQPGTVAAFCNNIAITGNSFSNSYGPAVYLLNIATAIVVSGNSFYNCCPVLTPITNALLQGNNGGALFANCTSITGCTFSGNTFDGCSRAIACFGTNNTIGQNSYLNQLAQNLIVRGNLLENVTYAAAPAYPTLNITNETTTYSTYTTGAPFVGSSTCRGQGGLTYIAATGLTLIWEVTYILPVTAYGNGFVSFSIAVGCTGSTLPGCTFSIYQSDVAGDANILIGTTTFTAPQSVNILTDPLVVLTVPVPPDLPIMWYLFQITPPGASVLNSRYATGTASSGKSNAGPIFTEWAFSLSATAYSLLSYLTLGEQGNNNGQVTIGASGSPITQITAYALSGNFPNPLPANSSTIIGPLVAVGVATTDSLTICSLIALPAGIIVTNAYAPSTGHISFSAVNTTTSSYTGAGAYSVKVLGYTV